MSDCMDYPQTLRKFVNDYSFNDKEEIYTNGSMLVPLFRIEQALDEHFMDIEKAQYKMDTDSAYECGYQSGYQQGGADAIDELRPFIHKNYKGQKFIFVCAEDFKNLDLWKQLKEQR